MSKKIVLITFLITIMNFGYSLDVRDYLILCEDDDILPTSEIFIHSKSFDKESAVVFEVEDNQIILVALDETKSMDLDVNYLHLYDNYIYYKGFNGTINVKIYWTKDSRIACLFINDELTAIFDFLNKIGCSKSGFGINENNIYVNEKGWENREFLSNKQLNNYLLKNIQLRKIWN